MLNNRFHLAVEDTGFLVHVFYVDVARVTMLATLDWITEA